MKAKLSFVLILTLWGYNLFAENKRTPNSTDSIEYFTPKLIAFFECQKLAKRESSDQFFLCLKQYLKHDKLVREYAVWLPTLTTFKSANACNPDDLAVIKLLSEYREDFICFTLQDGSKGFAFFEDDQITRISTYPRLEKK